MKRRRFLLSRSSENEQRYEGTILNPNPGRTRENQTLVKETCWTPSLLSPLPSWLLWDFLFVMGLLSVSTDTQFAPLTPVKGRVGGQTREKTQF